MSTIVPESISSLQSGHLQSIRAEESVVRWFAVYTTPRHEKRVCEHLEMRQIETFLPLYRSQRQWNNGCKVTVEMPVFPSYLFVRISRQTRVRVLEIPGVLSLVGTGREPTPLPEFEIESLRTALYRRVFEPHPYLVVGERVRIRSGALTGMEGILLRKKGSWRVVLALDLIMKSIAVEVAADEVEPCSPRVER